MPGSRTLPQLDFSSLQLPSPVTEIKTDLLSRQQVRLFIKRDELIHPILQGNKWRKLKYNLIQAKQQGQQSLLSFGGAYSNHLHALAAAGKMFNLNTTGIIRGQQAKILSPTLNDAKSWGMHLKFISRKEYKLKQSPEFLESLKQELGDFYFIPEGANNPQGLQGCAELLDELNDNYDVICTEVGSGTMLSALIKHNQNTSTRLLGFAVMKNRNLENEIQKNLPGTDIDNSAWSINHDYHFDGFAKSSAELNSFILNFYQQHAILLEPVYSGKMMFGLLDMIKKDAFKPGSKILAIHGGGLQGLRGYSELASLYPVR